MFQSQDTQQKYHSQLGFSTGEFQALQLIVLAILLKCKLNMLCSLPNAYINFQVDISKHYKKVWKTFRWQRTMVI